MKIVNSFSHYGNAPLGGGVQHVTEKFLFSTLEAIFAGLMSLEQDAIEREEKN